MYWIWTNLQKSQALNGNFNIRNICAIPYKGAFWFNNAISCNTLHLSLVALLSEGNIMLVAFHTLISEYLWQKVNIC